MPGTASVSAVVVVVLLSRVRLAFQGRPVPPGSLVERVK